MFKRSRHNNLSTLIISQNYYELPKGTIHAIGNTNHIYKANTFKDIQSLCQDKVNTVMPIDDIKFLTSTCWNKKSTSHSRYGKR